MYKKDLSLSNQHSLICFQAQPTNQPSNNFFAIKFEIILDDINALALKKLILCSLVEIQFENEFLVAYIIEDYNLKT